MVGGVFLCSSEIRIMSGKEINILLLCSHHGSPSCFRGQTDADFEILVKIVSVFMLPDLIRPSVYLLKADKDLSMTFC